MTNKLFVGGLEYATTDAQLEEHFAQAGNVLSAKVIIDRDTGRGKGFGFVEMDTADSAKVAIQQLDGIQLNGRSIAVKEATPRQ